VKSFVHSQIILAITILLRQPLFFNTLAFRTQFFISVVRHRQPSHQLSEEPYPSRRFASRITIQPIYHHNSERGSLYADPLPTLQSSRKSVSNLTSISGGKSASFGCNRHRKSHGAANSSGRDMFGGSSPDWTMTCLVMVCDLNVMPPSALQVTSLMEEQTLNDPV